MSRVRPSFRVRAAVLAVLVTVAGCASSAPARKPVTTATGTAPNGGAAASAPVSTHPCSWTPDTTSTVARKVTVPASTTPARTGMVSVAVQTTQGAMTFTLNRAGAPCTVASFVSLVAQKYYDKTPCHRLVTAGIFVLQCGDPTGQGNGGPGYTIPDEATGAEAYPAGTIAMARTADPHSGGSQFFIVYRDSPALMQDLGALQYTVFGKVSAGLGVVTKVAAKGAATGTDGAPKLPISLTTLTAK